MVWLPDGSMVQRRESNLTQLVQTVEFKTGKRSDFLYFFLGKPDYLNSDMLRDSNRPLRGLGQCL